MKKFSLFALTILSLGFVTFSCELLEGDAPIALSPNFIKNVAIVNFTDDTSDAEIGFISESFDGTSVTVTGPDKEMVTDLQGGKTFIIEGGSLTLMLNPNANFASQPEFNVNVIVEKNGYLKTIVPVKFVKDIAINNFTVAVVNTAKLPSETSLNTETKNIPFSTTALGADANDVKTTVTVPVGTVMKNASGDTLSGAVTTQVVSFNASKNSEFFPGGIESNNVKVGNGPIEEGIFTPAAFASVTMTVGGSAVKTFTENTVEVKMSLDKDAINDNTGVAYAVNDDIDVYSYDTATGQWQFEKTNKVEKDTDNSLFVRYEASHLSYFMVGKFSQKQLCSGLTKGATVKHKVTWSGSANTVNVSVRFNLKSDFYNYRTITRTFEKDGVFEIEPFTSQGSYSFKIYDLDSRGLIFTSVNKPNLCSAQTFNLGTINKGTNITMNFTASCKGIEKIEPPLGTRVFYKLQGATRYKLLHIVDSQISATRGSISTNLLEVGKTYDFKVVAGRVERFRLGTKIESTNNSYSLALGDALCNLLKK